MLLNLPPMGETNRHPALENGLRSHGIVIDFDDFGSQTRRLSRFEEVDRIFAKIVLNASSARNNDGFSEAKIFENARGHGKLPLLAELAGNHPKINGLNRRRDGCLRNAAAVGDDVGKTKFFRVSKKLGDEVPFAINM